MFTDRQSEELAPTLPHFCYVGRRCGVFPRPACQNRGGQRGQLKRTWVNHAQARDWMGPTGRGAALLLC